MLLKRVSLTYPYPTLAGMPTIQTGGCQFPTRLFGMTKVVKIIVIQ